MSTKSSNHKLTFTLLGLLGVTIILMVILAIAYTRNDDSELIWMEAREIEWDDLIPAGVPYGEIVSEGERDEENDIWKPGYDNNGLKLVTDFEGQLIEMPGFIVPLEYEGDGVTSFLLVPFYGACIHTPPPPPNQIVLVNLEEPMRFDDPYQPYWVAGNLDADMHETDLAFVGYSMLAQAMKPYDIELPEIE